MSGTRHNHENLEHRTITLFSLICKMQLIFLHAIRSYKKVILYLLCILCANIFTKMRNVLA
jgi:hypothetical protein